MIPISSEQILDNTEQHFRIFAGPGAGKTHWLVNHVRHVVRVSRRINYGSRIACISYTNVAVAELLGRIGDASALVEACTIHSFLFRHIVRPYLHLLRNPDESCLVQHELVDGHDEHYPTYTAFRSWLSLVGGKVWIDVSDASHYLKALRWVRDSVEDGWSLKAPNSVRPPKYLPTTRLLDYRKLFWDKGIIDHEDVLYFGYLILEQNPSLRAFIAAKFPYIFVDEFQDTNDIQSEIVRWLAGNGSVIGVIGDCEQSIYSFQGATPEKFTGFNLPGQADYWIENNRRSTNSIVNILNRMRHDSLEQKGLRGVEGRVVRVHVGNHSTNLIRARESLHPEAVVVALTRKNEQASLLRRTLGEGKRHYWKEFEGIDPERFRCWGHLIAAAELAARGSIALGVREVLRALRVRGGLIRPPFTFPGSITEQQRRGMGLAILEILIANYAEHSTKTFFDVNNGVSEKITAVVDGLRLSVIRSGKPANFARGVMYSDLVRSVPLADEIRDIRTIHKAKGAEFDHVMVVLDNERRLIEAFDKKVSRTEEHRTDYVAASRARDSLFFSVENLSSEAEARLTEFGMQVVRYGE